MSTIPVYRIISGLQPIVEGSWKLRTAMIELMKMGRLNKETIVAPINALLDTIGAPGICAVEPTTVVGIIAKAFNSYQQT